MPLFNTDAPSPAGVFGPDGTSGSSFGANSPGSLAFDNANHRLYAADSSVPGIYGFNVTSPPAAAPVSGFTPLAAASIGDIDQIAVDNSSTGSVGHLYFESSSTKKLYGFSSSGSALGGAFPIDLTANPDFLSGSDPCGVGVDSTGRIWVSDPNSAKDAPILRYSSAGGVQSSISAFFPCRLAFNAGDDLYQGRAGGQLVGRLDAPNYTSGSQVDGNNASQIAVDTSVNVAYVAESVSGMVGAYDTTNTHLFDFSDGVSGSTLRGIAVDPSNHYIYVSDATDHKIHAFAPGTAQTPPTITQQPPTAIAGSSVTLNAKVDPETFQVTDCHFEVVPDSQFKASGFTAVTVAEKHACSPDMTGPAGSGSGDVAVHADVSGLGGGTTYHTRIVAANAEPGGTSAGSDQSFDTLGPRIADSVVDHISDTAATLHASINPESQATTYQFQYTDDADFQDNVWTNAQTVPVSPADIGSGSIVVPVHEDIGGLDPDTKYHFRVVADSADATVAGPNTTFNTYAVPTPPQTDCPNQALRTGAGADLPDCRAYEQASLVDKHGSHAFSSYQFSAAAADGNGVTYAVISGLGISGGSTSPYPVIARRGADGWTSHGVTPVLPPGLGATGFLGWNSDLTTTVSYKDALYVGDVADDSWASPFSLSPPANIQGIPGFAADPQHFLLFSTSDLAFGGIVGKPNLYEYDHGKVSLAGRIPAGSATACNDQGGPACVAAPEGVAIPQIQNPISQDGSRVFFGAPDTGRLYLRADGDRTVQISAPAPGAPADPNGHKPATLLAVSDTGSVAYFMSCEKLTADSTAVSTAANTCSTTSQGSDLYAYHADSGELDDLSVDANGDPHGADVRGVAGISADGSWVYFVANGSLASGAPTGNCADPGGTSPGTGSCGLYVSHDGGAPAYLGTLPGVDRGDWGGLAGANVSAALPSNSEQQHVRWSRPTAPWSCRRRPS